MVGVLVAMVKIADYGTVIPGTALFVLWVLVFILVGMRMAIMNDRCPPSSAKWGPRAGRWSP